MTETIGTPGTTGREDDAVAAEALEWLRWLARFAEAGRSFDHQLWDHARGKHSVSIGSARRYAAEAHMSVEAVIEVLWGERVGDPCACGCGGVKELPQAPNCDRTGPGWTFKVASALS